MTLEGETGAKTVAFVDLAGFTALTEAHGDDHAADEAIAFAEAVRSSLPHDGRLIKTMGDGALVLLLTPADGLGFFVRLATEVQACSSLQLRGGLHVGPLVERDGDVFGGTVNVAARLAAFADAHQVLASQPVAEEARRAGYPITSLGHRTLRNLSEPLEIFDLGLLPHRAGSTFVDPVCQMSIPEDLLVGELRYAEHLFQFCSLECAQRFAANPDHFAREGAR